MGRSHSRSQEAPKLKSSELQEFSRQSLFSVQVVEKLYNHYYRIASSKNDDGVIDLDEFCSNIHDNASRSRILQGLFNLFDVNTDGGINFREFLQGLSIFNKVDHLGNNMDSSPMIAAAKTKEKIGFALRFLEADKKKKIYMKEVLEMLVSAVREDIGLKLSSETLKKIVKKSFLEEDWQEEAGEKFLTVESYTKMVMRRPEQLDWLAPDMERIMQERKKGKQKGGKTRCLSV